MNSHFELQINFKNDCNWICALLVEFKIPKHTRLYRRRNIYDKKKPRNIHKNSLYSKRHLISNVIVMDNYKWCFKKQFLSLGKYKYRSHVWQDTNVVIWAFLFAIMGSHSLLLKLRHLGWNFSGYGYFMSFSLALPTGGEQSLTITLSTNQSFCHNNFEIQ